MRRTFRAVIMRRAFAFCFMFSSMALRRERVGVRLAILRFSISGEIIRKVLRPSRPRVQTSTFLGRFNLDVAKQNRAARFRIDVGAPANINARISHLAESETASLKNAHAAAGADAIGTFRRKVNDLLAQADAYRDLSSALAFDEVGGAAQ